MKRMSGLLSAATLACPCVAQPHPPSLAPPIHVDGVALAVPTPAQAAWHDLEVGMFIHIAPQTWQDRETDDLSTPLSAINPHRLDTDQWADVASRMGAKYIIFVAKHEGGFCWWQTDTTDFSVRNTPWLGGKGDVLADLSTSCREYGIKLGVYLSPQDRKHGVGIGGKAKDESRQAEYESLFRRQLVEVLTRYGEMIEVWFDGSLVFDVGDILKQHAPDAVVFQGPQATIRWVGNEDGIAPDPAWNAVKSPVDGGKKWGDYTADDGDPAGDRWLPNECDARIRATWFWRTDNLHTLKSVEQLMDMYEKSVGRGGVLLLNNTPDRTGLIPDEDAARSEQFGEAVARAYSRPIAQASGKGMELSVSIARRQVNRVMIMEDITRGERVRRYVVEGRDGDGDWKVLSRGTAIGHKKIDGFPDAWVTSVRLRVEESVGVPIFRKLSVHKREIQERLRPSSGDGK